MTRKFLQDIRGQIASTLPDNTAGLINPANHRTLLTDFLDSTTALRGELFSPTPVPGVSVGNTFQPVVNYEQVNGGDPSFLVMDPVTGTITSGATAGFDYRIIGQIQIEGGNGTGFEVGIGAGGVVSSFVSGITGRGAGNPITGLVVSDIFNGAATTAIDLRIRNINGGTETITQSQVSLVAILLPTESPT